MQAYYREEPGSAEQRYISLDLLKFRALTWNTSGRLQAGAWGCVVGGARGLGGLSAKVRPSAFEGVWDCNFLIG
jgi:hypothetical protein